MLEHLHDSLARFKANGAHVARTMVRAQDKEIDAFLRGAKAGEFDDLML